MRQPLKPAQAECRRCEKLFCFFYRTTPRVFCGPCVELNRVADNDFYKAQRRKQAAVRAYEDRSIKHFARFSDGGFILEREWIDA